MVIHDHAMGISTSIVPSPRRPITQSIQGCDRLRGGHEAALIVRSRSTNHQFWRDSLSRASASPVNPGIKSKSQNSGNSRPLNSLGLLHLLRARWRDVLAFGCLSSSRNTAPWPNGLQRLGIKPPPPFISSCAIRAFQPQNHLIKNRFIAKLIAFRLSSAS